MFQRIVKTYKLCAVEKDRFMVIWKFIALSKARLKHESQQAVCGQLGNCHCNLGVSFLFLHKTSDKCFQECTSESHLKFRRNVSRQV